MYYFSSKQTYDKRLSGLFIGISDHLVWVIILPQKGHKPWFLYEPYENCCNAACIAMDKTMTSLETSVVNCAYNCMIYNHEEDESLDNCQTVFFLTMASFYFKMYSV